MSLLSSDRQGCSQEYYNGHEKKKFSTFSVISVVIIFSNQSQTYKFQDVPSPSGHFDIKTNLIKGMFQKERDGKIFLQLIP